MEKGNNDLCQIIVDNVKEKNPADCLGITPLHLAANHGHLSVCQLIIKHLDYKNPECINGFTPLVLALTNDHVHVVEYFQSAFLGCI